MLYCTACKQYAQQDGPYAYREGYICPNCGQSRLIERPSAGGFNLNLGDANAISGGVNLNDSHDDNSQHYDQRGMIQAGTYNAAQKSDREVDLLNISKGRQLYTEACEKFIGNDGVIDIYEERELSKIQTEYGLSAEWCKQEKERVRILLRNNNSLSKSARYDLDDLVYAIKDNDIHKAITYVGRLSSLIKEKDHEELQYYYHMAIAILQPKECLSMFEKTTNHNYWHTFWSYLAYLKENNIEKARKVHNSLDSYRNYPEDNDMLIRTAGECILGDKAAERDFSRIDSGYSPILEDLYKSMTLLVKPDIAKREGLVEKDYLFYIKHIFNCETTEEREKREREEQKAREAEERRLKAEAEAKRKAEERARIKAEQEAQRKREEEERKRKEAEERRKAEEERKRKEAEERRKAEEERKRKEAEAKRKREEEERKRAEEKARKEEETRRRAAEAEAKRKAEEEARRIAAIEAQRREEEERKRKEAEAKRRREEEYRKRMEEARAKAELEAKRRAEDKSTITVSKTSLTFSADGGSETVNINASGFWQLSAVPDNWAIVEERTNSIVIKALKNEAEKVRTDYLKIKCGYKEARVDIKQEANLLIVQEEDTCVLYRVRRNKTFIFVDKTGRERISVKYDSVESFSEGLAKVELGRKYGCIDQTGREVIPCKFDYIHKEFPDGIAKVQLGKKYGYIDKDGREIAPCKYDDVDYYFHDGLAKVMLNNKCGYIDKTGREIIPCKYDDAGPFYDGLAMVVLNGKYGYLDKTGHEIIPCEFDEAQGFSEGLAVVGQKKGFLKWISKNATIKYGYIDQMEREVIPCRFDSAKSFHNGLALVKVDEKWGVIDKTGSVITPCKYDTIKSFREGFAQVRLGKRWGYIDNTGREVVPCKYDYVDSFHEGLAGVKLGGKWGCIDKTGREITPCKYDNPSEFTTLSFSEGLAEVKSKGKWGYIDKTGREIVPCKYDNVYSFKEGLALVELNKKCGYINKAGHEVIPCKYDNPNDIFF